ncbi:hypothetical protein A5871_001318, partial [Enterococcus sp. 2F9_DIV0599]
GIYFFIFDLAISVLTAYLFFKFRSRLRR